MNKSKIKVMVVSKWKLETINIKVGEEKIKEVREFKYLGSLITRMEEVKKK